VEPALIDRIGAEPGMRSSGVAAPITPSCPSELEPQQNGTESTAMAHVCDRPALIDMNVRPVSTGSGTRLQLTAGDPQSDAVWVTPSWKLALLPQHQAFPPVSSAQVCVAPTLTVRHRPMPTSSRTNAPGAAGRSAWHAATTARSAILFAQEQRIHR
jgi:hypothetical protein